MFFLLLVDTSHYNDFINNNDLHNIVRVTQSTPDRRKDDDDDDDDDNDFPNMVPSSDALPPDYSRRVVSDQAAQAIRPSHMSTSEDKVRMILPIEIMLKDLTTSYSPPCLLFFIFLPMILAI